MVRVVVVILCLSQFEITGFWRQESGVRSQESEFAYNTPMRFCRVPLIFFLSVGFLSAQLSTNTITVTASQNASSQPDEALFSLTVASSVNQGLNDVVSALTSVGITSADLTGLLMPSRSCHRVR